MAHLGVEVSQSDENHVLLKTHADPRENGEEEKADVRSAGGLDALEQTGRKKDRTARRGLFVEVNGGILSAEVVAVPASGVQAESPISYPLGTNPKLIGPAVEAHLRKQLLEAGLKEPEADAMIATWRKQFFQTDGRRFILQMSAVDSDSLCPLSVSPPPTELVRVGLIWTELQAK